MKNLIYKGSMSEAYPLGIYHCIRGKPTVVPDKVADALVKENKNDWEIETKKKGSENK